MRKLFALFAMIVPLTVMAQEKKSCCPLPESPTAEFALLASDETFRISHAEPLPFTFTGEKGAWVTFKTPDGSEGRAFEVKADKATENFVMLIHEWWGLNDYIKQEAEKLQQALGNANVLALDLYDKRVAGTREEAGKYMGEVKEERARRIIQGALKYVGPKARIATLGWCFGGGWSLQAALMGGNQTVACVMYYGMPETNVEKLKTLKAPVLGIFAKKDGWITPKVVEEFERNMKGAQKTLTVRWYDGDHAFANPSNPQYDKTATEEAWKHVLEFFRGTLK